MQNKLIRDQTINNNNTLYKYYGARKIKYTNASVLYWIVNVNVKWTILFPASSRNKELQP